MGIGDLRNGAADKHFGIGKLPDIGACPAMPEITVALGNIAKEGQGETKVSVEDILRGMASEFILYAEVDCGGRKMDLVFDSGCTITMVSGKTSNHVQRTFPGTRFIPFPKPLPVSHAKKGGSLFAVGVTQVPWTFYGFRRENRKPGGTRADQRGPIGTTPSLSSFSTMLPIRVL